MMEKKRRIIKTIGIVFNLKKRCRPGDDRDEEFDEIATIRRLKKEIESRGFRVILFEYDASFPWRVQQQKPDFVFNIAEGLGRTRARESQVPCILESLGIPYSGSDPVALGIAQDKYLARKLLQSAKIPVPLVFTVKRPAEIPRLRHIFRRRKYFIVKPRWEGSSKGIFLHSVVNNFPALQSRIRAVLRRYQQPALIEEFLEKEEITAGVCGNDTPQVIGMMQIASKQKEHKHFIYSLEQKRDWKNKIVYLSEKSIPERTRRVVERCALRAYEALELNDLVRIDFRLNRQGTPKIIDINPLPGLSAVYSDLPIIYSLNGKKYSDLIGLVLAAAFKRCGCEPAHPRRFRVR